jgi:RND family efflux transporter MFP subunit
MQVRGLLTGIIAVLLVVATAGGAWWLIAHPPQAKEKAKQPAPAKITLNEADINVITLSPEGFARLVIETAEVERKSVPVARSFGAEIVLPPGQSIVVSAPVSGELRAPAQGAIRAGEQLSAGQPVFDLLPILTPEGRANLTTALVDAEGQVNTAKTQCDLAQVAYDRALRLFKSEAGSQRAVDETLAQLNVAKQTCEAVVARHTALQDMLGEVKSGTAAPLNIESPRSGILRVLSAVPMQAVPAGAPLFEVVDLTRLWVRVPVFVGDADQLDDKQDATITDLTAKPGMTGVTATPVLAPPTANPQAATVDLYYELDNERGRHRPGERVAAQIQMQGSADSLTVPWSAIIYDVYGGTWVYEQTGEHTFVRQRVILRRVQNDLAVLDAGPPPGTKVVIAGAAELFGTETGFTK